MNPIETGTQMDLAELSRSRPGSYSTLMNEILASPAEVPSPLLTSDDFRFPASATDWSVDQWFADLETRLFEAKPFQSQLWPALPQPYDGSRASRKNFIHACQAYFRLRPDQFPDEHTKVQWAMTYMCRDCAEIVPRDGLLEYTTGRWFQAMPV